jgi:hypothetical protein
MDSKRILHDVEVLMRRNHGRGVVFFAPVGSNYAAQDLASDPKKMLFIFDLIDADPKMASCTRSSATIGSLIWANGFHEHAAELLEGFGLSIILTVSSTVGRRIAKRKAAVFGHT